MVYLGRITEALAFSAYILDATEAHLLHVEVEENVCGWDLYASDEDYAAASLLLKEHQA